MVSIHEKATLLRDTVFGINDGIITTFAVVAGAAGANLASNVILILGFANLFADAISMAAGNYLGIKSENEFQEGNKQEEIHPHSPVKHGIATFFAFVLAGIIPLLPFVGLVGSFKTKILISTLLVFLTLFFTGSLKAYLSKRNSFKGGVEMLVVGGVAALVAYFVGDIIEGYMG